jgi:hypothetical protein
VMNFGNFFNYETYHTSNICLFHLILLNRIWNPHLNPVWSPWPWVVQSWLIGFMIIELMVLRNSLGFPC